MKITLTQGDIVEALRMHVASQGISLVGKSVDIKFTMKKHGAGVEADVTIENGPQLPDLSDVIIPRASLAVAVDNTARVVAAVPEAVTTVTPLAVADLPSAIPVQESPAAETPADPAEPVAEPSPAAKTTSLFN